MRKSLAACGLGLTGGACYYTWRVEERKKIRAEEAAAKKRLVIGSIDDLTADGLRVGDLIAFERDCSVLHLHLAAHCLMTKQLLRVQDSRRIQGGGGPGSGSVAQSSSSSPAAVSASASTSTRAPSSPSTGALEFGERVDQVGIVFLDPVSKLPLVLEAVPWQGVTATPYAERVNAGDASRISILPLRLAGETSGVSESSRGSADGTGGGGSAVAAFRRRRVDERINAFAQGARSSTKVPTSAKDSVGLVLNALLKAKVVDPDPVLHNVTPADLATGNLPLKEGARYEPAIPVRAFR